jgi:hypothetical protein
MEDLTMEQILELGRQHYPEMDPNVLMQKFEEIRAKLPADFTNLEVAQVIFQSKGDQSGGRFGGLADKLGR